LLSNETAHISLWLDSRTSKVTTAARRWSNHPGGYEVSEAIVWCVEWRESGDRATSIGDDHLFTGLHAIDVLAETILEVANPDLRSRSSYVHTISVATSTALSTPFPESRCRDQPLETHAYPLIGGHRAVFLSIGLVAIENRTMAITTSAMTASYTAGWDSPPDVDRCWALQVEQQVRKSADCHDPKVRNSELVREPERPEPRISTDTSC